MRLTTVTLAFIFFGTVFATPVFPPRGNAVELSKRMPPKGSTDTASPSPSRGRSRKKKSSTSRARGKQKATGDEGDGEDDGTPERSGSKRKAPDDASGSRKRGKKNVEVCKDGLVSEDVFMAAMRNINKNYIGQGSQGLAVYKINGLVNGCNAVVKIIDRVRFDDAQKKKIPVEVAGLLQAQQLLGWGTRAKPQLDYILMKHMGGPLRDTNLRPIEDGQIIEELKAAALQRYENQFNLKHLDPAGNGNYLWEPVNEDDADKKARYIVNVIDWADYETIGPMHGVTLKPPTAFVVPNEKAIYGPTSSPESSDKPSSGSDGEKKADKAGKYNIYAGATGSRSSSRVKAMQQGSSGQQQGSSDQQQ